MTTLVVGDVHGCAVELGELVDLAGAAQVVSVGDLFTKGPDPVGVWRLVREHALRAVMGNHEVRLTEIVDGLRPRDAEGTRCVDVLTAADPAWLPWVRALPLTLSVGDVTVVHAALHPDGPAATTRHIATKLRRWPDDDDDDPPWWQVYAGAQRVVFGHDARGGLVRVERHGRPWLMGLDTGCVYGGKLTGWIPEQDRLVQVAARRSYAPIGG